MAEYTTRLCKRVSLVGQWEVALSEILFSKNWYNLNDDDMKFKVQFRHVLRGDSGNLLTHKSYRFDFSKGLYLTGSALAMELNNCVKTTVQALTEIPKFPNEKDMVKTGYETNSWPYFTYNEHTDKLTVKLPYGMSLNFNDSLQNITGFMTPIRGLDVGDVDRTKTPRNCINTVVADRSIQLNDSLETFYVYCNILENIRVGDSETPLLKIVNTGTASEHGQLIKRDFNLPLYVPVQSKNFDEIQIKILTDQGTPVPFHSGGRVIITLHFKQIL